MYGTLALAARLVGRVEIGVADLHDSACPPLTEVELFCSRHGDGWAVHVWPVTPPCYQPYAATNQHQADLIDLVSVVTV